MNRLRILFFALGLVVGGEAIQPVFASDTLDSIYALADRKDFDTALKKLTVFLAENPKDAQGRFLQGLILTETKQRDQAIQVFLQLSKDFPELPEPYNNLAVLFAEQGQFKKAEESLQQAITAHPNYATAHENLGDIYTKMASQAYIRAYKLNQNNTTLVGKINKIKTIFGDGTQETASAQKSAPPPVPVAVTPTPAKAPQPTTAEKPVARTETPTLNKETPPQTESKSASKVQGGAVEDAIHAWADAWSNKDLERYLTAYSAHFTPINKSFKNREDWEKSRRDVIGRRGSISVKVSDLQVTMLNENRAQATFVQKYSAKNHRDRVKKTLSLERENNEWKIVREYADE
ncbi:MAG: tetratricopeptide repeat protein [Magnetococcales bacterium]|nr:tetratricopeptide repeat protein [Magnetococcales bacterium]MBF0437963.1 tetratricopeptide repeat protein [Magnetococcales bacterium]